jgi:arylsulfatase A-like enzyme
LFLGPAATAANEPVRKPNVVFLLADDLGYGDLSCYGHKDIRTPHLDGLAAAGVQLTQFYVTSPVCSPTRASFLTGRHPQRLGIQYADLPNFSRRYGLPRTAPTLADHLRKAGYATAHFGKWHLGEPSRSGWPREHGFDEFFGHVGGLPSSVWGKYSRSFDAKFIHNEAAPRVFPGHVTDVTTDHTLKYLDQAAAVGKPFYVDVWFNAPHEPLTDRVAQYERFRRRTDLNERQKVYYATVENLDANVGRLLAKLRERKLNTNTLVFFSSDNGPEEHKGRHSAGSTDGLRGMKGYLWEGGIREPALLRLPGRLPAGQVSSQVASALDWVPTVCALAGVAAPRDLDEGVNLLPLLQGDKAPQPRTLFFEHHSPTPFHARFHAPPADKDLPRTQGEAQPGTLAIRDGDWKLHLDLQTGRRQLYNLAVDRWERTDQSSRQTEVADRLERRLRDWYAGLPKEEPGDITRVDPPATEAEADALLQRAAKSNPQPKSPK